MMKKILFLTPQLPYPANSGGLIKTQKLLEYFSNKYELHLCCFLKGSNVLNPDNYLTTTKIADVKYYSFEKKRTLANYLKSIIYHTPLSVYRNRSTEMFDFVKQKAMQVDTIFIDHFIMAQYVPKSFTGHVVLHQHNAEYVMWDRCAAYETNILKKLVLKYESKRIQAYERSICKFSAVILAAPNDITALMSLGISKDKFFETLHLGDEELIGLPNISYKDTEQSLLVIGSLDWEANRDGLLWFLRKVWPLLSKEYASLRFNIIGRNPGEEVENEVSRHDGISLLGFVDDLNQYYSSSRVFLAPLRFGSGIKVKIINALYRGIPISTTSIGAEGLAVETGRDIYIADSAEEMANQIAILLNDEQQWNEIRDNSRALARKYYTWDTTLKVADKALNAIKQ